MQLNVGPIKEPFIGFSASPAENRSMSFGLSYNSFRIFQVDPKISFGALPQEQALKFEIFQFDFGNVLKDSRPRKSAKLSPIVVARDSVISSALDVPSDEIRSEWSRMFLEQEIRDVIRNKSERNIGVWLNRVRLDWQFHVHISESFIVMLKDILPSVYANPKKINNLMFDHSCRIAPSAA